MAVLSLTVLLLGLAVTSADQVSARLCPSSLGFACALQRYKVTRRSSRFARGTKPLAAWTRRPTASVKSALTPHTHAFTLLHKKCKIEAVLFRFTSGSGCRTSLTQAYGFLLACTAFNELFSLLLQAGEVDRKGKSCQFYFLGGLYVRKSWGFPPDAWWKCQIKAGARGSEWEGSINAALSSPPYPSLPANPHEHTSTHALLWLEHVALRALWYRKENSTSKSSTSAFHCEIKKQAAST